MGTVIDCDVRPDGSEKLVPHTHIPGGKLDFDASRIRLIPVDPEDEERRVHWIEARKKNTPEWQRWKKSRLWPEERSRPGYDYYEVGKMIANACKAAEESGLIVLNACVFDYLRKNPGLIPAEWKDVGVVFANTVFGEYSRYGKKVVCGFRQSVFHGLIRSWIKSSLFWKIFSVPFVLPLLLLIAICSSYGVRHRFVPNLTVPIECKVCFLAGLNIAAYDPINRSEQGIKSASS